MYMDEYDVNNNYNLELKSPFLMMNFWSSSSLTPGQSYWRKCYWAVIFLFNMPDKQQHTTHMHTSGTIVLRSACLQNKVMVVNTVGVNNSSLSWCERTNCICLLTVFSSLSSLQGIFVLWCTGGFCSTSLPQLSTCSILSLDWL